MMGGTRGRSSRVANTNPCALKGQVAMLFITHALPKGLLIDEVIQIGGGQGSDRLSVVSGTFEQRPKGIL